MKTKVKIGNSVWSFVDISLIDFVYGSVSNSVSDSVHISVYDSVWGPIYNSTILRIRL